MKSKSSWPPVIPEHLKELSCKCAVPHKMGYSAFWNPKSVAENPGKIHAPLGQYCFKCLRPVGYTVLYAVVTCEGCGSYFIPMPTEGTYPIKHALCSKCDVPVRTRKTRKITFNV